MVLKSHALILGAGPTEQQRTCRPPHHKRTACAAHYKYDVDCETQYPFSCFKANRVEWESIHAVSLSLRWKIYCVDRRARCTFLMCSESEWERDAKPPAATSEFQASNETEKRRLCASAKCKFCSFSLGISPCSLSLHGRLRPPCRINHSSAHQPGERIVHRDEYFSLFSPTLSQKFNFHRFLCQHAKQ